MSDSYIFTPVGPVNTSEAPVELNNGLRLLFTGITTVGLSTGFPVPDPNPPQYMTGNGTMHHTPRHHKVGGWREHHRMVATITKNTFTHPAILDSMHNGIVMGEGLVVPAGFTGTLTMLEADRHPCVSNDTIDVRISTFGIGFMQLEVAMDFERIDQ